MANTLNDLISVDLKISKRALELLGGLANVPTGAIAVRCMDVVKDTVVNKYLNGEGVSKSWKPLSKQYAKWKMKAAPGQPKLVLSGALRAAVADAPVEEIPGGAKMTISGTAIPYARIHQYGGMTGRGHRSKIPRRTYLQVADLETKKKLQQAAVDALVSAARELMQGDVGAYEDLLRQGIRARIGLGSSKTALRIVNHEKKRSVAMRGQRRIAKFLRKAKGRSK